MTGMENLQNNLLEGNYTVRIPSVDSRSTELVRVRVKDLKKTDRKGDLRDIERYKRKLMHLPQEIRPMIRRANLEGKLVIWQTQKGIIEFAPSRRELYEARRIKQVADRGNGFISKVKSMFNQSENGR